MALWYWWFSATLGDGMSTEARPTAAISASVSAPARLMTRSAAASISGMLSMYSRMMNFGLWSMPSRAARAAKSAFSMLPVACT